MLAERPGRHATELPDHSTWTHPMRPFAASKPLLCNRFEIDATESEVTPF
jgi:hypothetical protein